MKLEITSGNEIFERKKLNYIFVTNMFTENLLILKEKNFKNKFFSINALLTFDLHCVYIYFYLILKNQQTKLYVYQMKLIINKKRENEWQEYKISKISLAAKLNTTETRRKFFGFSVSCHFTKKIVSLNICSISFFSFFRLHYLKCPTFKLYMKLSLFYFVDFMLTLLELSKFVFIRS